MLDLKFIVKNIDETKNKLSSRNFDILIIDNIVKLSKNRSKVMSIIQTLENKKNELSKIIGEIKQKNGDVNKVMNDVLEIKLNIEKIREKEVTINKQISNLLLEVPNIPNKNTPIGNDEKQNICIAEHEFGRGKVSGVIPHYDIGINLDIVDFKRSVKLAGSRFWSYKGQGAKLVRALESFMLDLHAKKGYMEIMPPIMVNSKAMRGTGQLPKFGNDSFKIEGKDAWLIPSAEVPLTNFYSGEIIDLSKPIMLTAYTPCFRSEAGSGGRDTKGLIRSHQFNKVELVKLVKKNDLEVEFKKTVEDAKNVLEKLELSYREVRLVTGDIGFSAEETIDLEVWIPSENKYREISSISSFGEYQGRRANIRYRNEKGEIKIANTINGSGLAIDRTIAAILENYQNENGTITIPNVLVKYMDSNFIK